jgi:LacI family transcriptional regulator
MAKPTITQLAKHLGVSICTVNKALSGKSKISEATRRRVVEEANRLGYRPSRAAQVLARNPIRLAFVHPAHYESFYAPFAEGIRMGVDSLVDCRVSMSLRKLDPAAWAAALPKTIRSLVRSGLSGLILSPLPGPDYREVWDLLTQHRVTLVQLGLESPGSPAALTVRQDAYASGRIAAELLSHFPGPAAVMIGDRRIADHNEKILAFQAEAADRGLPVAEICEHFDDPELGYSQTHRLFQKHPNVGGLYVATDNFIGICRAIEERSANDRPKVVATGLFPDIRKALECNLVHFALDQRMAEQGELAVHCLHDLLSGIPIESKKILLQPLVAVRGNIDALSTRQPVMNAHANRRSHRILSHLNLEPRT